MITDTSQPKEGMVAKAIENQTAKIPSNVYLYAAIGAIATSLVLQTMGHKNKSLFIGQWVAPFLLFGIYNKLVKQLGHDKDDNEQQEEE